MKKLILIILAFVPFLFACNKSSSDVPVVVNLETPKNAENATRIVIATPISVETVDKGVVAIREIQFLRSGRYVALADVTKATETVILTGTYTVNDEGVYETAGDIEVSVKTTEDTVTIDNECAEAVFVGSDIEEGSTEDYLCRTWKLDNIVLNFQRLGAEAKYYNITSIVEDLMAHEVEFSDEVKQRMLNHEIDEISVDEGVILVTFTNASPFIGEWNLNGTSSFSYHFVNDTASDIFESSATGEISFKDNKAVVFMSIKSGIEDLGDGSAIVTLVEAE